MEVADRLLASLAFDELVEHAGVERAGTIERVHGDQVLEASRAQIGEELAHPSRLHLEDADRVAAAEHLVSPLVIERSSRQIELDCLPFSDAAHRAFDERQRLQAEEVE